MHIYSRSIVVVALALAATACKDQSSAGALTAPAVPTRDTKLEAEVQELRTEVAQLRERLDELGSRVAVVSPEDQAYDIARTPYGPFTVSVRSATPYLDGYKVKLRFGNLTAASFDGMKVSVQWGPSIESVTAAEWVKQRKKKQFDLPTRMATGAFTDIELALTPATPAEIKQLTVGLELDQLSLRTR